MASDTTGKPAKFDQAIEAAVEAEIREFVQRDGVSVRRTSETDSELLANSIEALVQRVAGTSVQEIDGLIAELRVARTARRGGSPRSAQPCRICASEPIGHAVDEDHR